MDKVYIIPEYKLDMVNFNILLTIIDGLKKDLMDFDMKDAFGDMTKNNWDVMKGSLRYYIEKGFKKWLKAI